MFLKLLKKYILIGFLATLSGFGAKVQADQAIDNKLEITGAYNTATEEYEITVVVKMEPLNVSSGTTTYAQNQINFKNYNSAGEIGYSVEANYTTTQGLRYHNIFNYAKKRQPQLLTSVSAAALTIPETNINPFALQIGPNALLRILNSVTYDETVKISIHKGMLMASMSDFSDNQTVNISTATGPAVQLKVDLKGYTLNTPPVAIDDTATAIEDGADVQGNVLNNDTDADSDALFVTGFENSVPTVGTVGQELKGKYGWLRLDAYGNYNYRLDNTLVDVNQLYPNYSPSIVDEFKYSIKDSNEAAANVKGTLRITIEGANDAPVAGDDTGTVTEDGPDLQGTSVLANDTDADGDDNPSANGKVTSIKNSQNPTGTVGASLRGYYGSLIIQEDGTYVYKLDNANTAVNSLDPRDTLQDVFQYIISDDGGKQAAKYGTITVTIQGANDAPVAVADVAEVFEDGATLNSDTILANDTDVDGDDTPSTNGEVVGIKTNSQTGQVASPLNGQYGALTIEKNGTFSYTVDNTNPAVDSLDVGDTLTDVFTYTMQDHANGKTATSTLSITIKGANDAPVAVNDTGTVTEDGVKLEGISVLANDTDVDGDDTPSTNGKVVGIKTNSQTGQVASSLNGQYGALTIEENGTFSYTVDNTNAAVDALDVGDTLTDVFTYTMQDHANGKTDTATLSITIQGANDAPVAVDDAAEVFEDDATLYSDTILANDTDVDGDDTPYNNGEVVGIKTSTQTGQVASPLNGQYGALTIEKNGTFSYKVDNTNPAVDSLDVGDTLTDVFTYTLMDHASGKTDTATLSITIKGANDAPVALNDTFAVFEDAVAAPSPVRLLQNDTDVDGDDTPSINGSVVGIRTGTETSGGSQGTINGALAGKYGSLTVQADGTYLYVVDNNNNEVDVLDEGDSLNDIFTYTVSDKGGLKDTGELTVTIHGVNDSPRLTTIASEHTFVENAVSIKLFYGTTISLVEADQKIISGQITVSGLVNGSNEQIIFDSSVISLSNGAKGVTQTSGWDYNVSVTGSTAVLSFTNLGISASNLVSLIDGIKYNNLDDDPKESQRVVTLNYLQDNGGTANGGQDTATYNLSSTITVLPVNDAPSLTLSGLDPEYLEDQSAVAIFNVAHIGLVEDGQRVKELELIVSGLIDGSDELFYIDGASFPLVSGTSGTTTASGVGYSVSDVEGTLTVVLNFEAVTLDDAKSLISSMGYLNANSAHASDGQRVFTGVRMQDNGGIENSGNDTVKFEYSSTVTVKSVNDAPSITAPATISFDEDTYIFFNGGSKISLQDVDAVANKIKLTIKPYNGKLAFASTSNVALTESESYEGKTYVLEGSMSAINNALVDLVYHPNPQYYGLTSMDLKVEDLGNRGLGGNLSDEASVALKIAPVQDVPQLFGLPLTVETNEDVNISKLEVGLVDFDPENQKLNLVAEVVQSVNNPLQSVQVEKQAGNAWYLHIAVVPDAFGYGQIKLTYSDDHVALERMLTVKINQVDDASFGELLMTGKVEEGGLVTADTTGIKDADGPLTFSIQWQIKGESGDWANIPGATSAQYTIAPDQSLVGSSLRVQATSTDILGGVNNHTSAASVIANVEDAPTVELVSEVTAGFTSGLTFDVSISDSDTPFEKLEIAVSSVSSQLIDIASLKFTRSETGGRVTADVLPGVSGSGAVTLTVSDSIHTVVKEVSFDLVNNNQSPTLEVAEEVSTIEDVALTFTLTVEDDSSAAEELNLEIKGDDLGILDWENTEKSWLDSVTAKITIPVIANANGNGEMSISVSDGEHSTTQSVSYVVESVNDAPAFSSVEARTYFSGDAFEIELNVTDVDGNLEDLTFTYNAIEPFIVTSELKLKYDETTGNLRISGLIGSDIPSAITWLTLGATDRTGDTTTEIIWLFVQDRRVIEEGSGFDISEAASNFIGTRTVTNNNNGSSNIKLQIQTLTKRALVPADLGNGGNSGNSLELRKREGGARVIGNMFELPIDKSKPYEFWILE